MKERLWAMYGCSDSGVLFSAYSLQLFNDSACAVAATPKQISREDPSIPARNPVTLPFDQCASNVPPVPFVPMGPGPVIPPHSNVSFQIPRIPLHKEPDPSTWLTGAPFRQDNSADFDLQQCSHVPGSPTLEFMGFAKIFFRRVVWADASCGGGNKKLAMSEEYTATETCYRDLSSESNSGVYGSLKFQVSQSLPASYNGSSNPRYNLAISALRFVDPNCVVPVTVAREAPAPASASASASASTSASASASGVGAGGDTTSALVYFGPTDACQPSFAGTSFSYSVVTESINLAKNPPLDIEDGIVVTTFSTQPACQTLGALPDSTHVFATGRCLPVFEDGVVVSSMIYSCEQHAQQLQGGQGTYIDGTYTVTSFADSKCSDLDSQQIAQNPLQTMCMDRTVSAASFGFGNSTQFRNIMCHSTPRPSPRPSLQPTQAPVRLTRSPSPARPRPRPLQRPTAEPTDEPTSAPSRVVAARRPSSRSSPVPASKRPTPYPTPSLVVGQGPPISLPPNGANSASEARQEVPGLKNNELYMLITILVLVFVFAAALKAYAMTTNKTVWLLCFGRGDRIPRAINETATVSPVHHLPPHGFIEDHHATPTYSTGPGLQRPSYDMGGLELPDQANHARL